VIRQAWHGVSFTHFLRCQRATDHRHKKMAAMHLRASVLAERNCATVPPLGAPRRHGLQYGHARAWSGPGRAASSLPGLTLQGITVREKARWMSIDARVKPAHDVQRIACTW